MAYGAHWEWRGFGGVNGTFADRFSNLEKIIDEHRQSDFYVYVQRLNTNLKVRQGEENELKFKRPDIFAGNFEMWSEQEDELFDFPLSKEGRSMLKKNSQYNGIECSWFNSHTK